jgi:hypothetical protein
VTQTKRDYRVESTLQSIRRTQLDRTIAHEIVGHYAHYLATPRAEYAAKPHVEREAYASRYADALQRDLSRDGRIPFARMEDSLRLGADGLQKAWFGVA